MRYRALENQIKQTLEEDEVAIDIAALQASLQAQLSKKRRYPFLWLFGTSLGLAGIGLLYFMTSSMSQTISKTSEIKASSLAHFSITENGNNTYDNTAANIKIENTPDVKSRDELASIQFNNEIETAENTRSQIQNTDKLDSKINDNNRASIVVKQGQGINNKQNNTFQKSNSSEVENSNTDLKNNIPLSTNNISKSNMETLVHDNIKNSNNELILSEILNKEKTNESILQSKKVFSINYLPSTGLNLINSINLFSLKGKEILCPTFDRRKGQLLLSFIPEVGYFIPIKKLEANQPDLPNGVFSLRYDNEQSLEGISAGAHLKIGKSDFPFYVKGGVVMSRITEKMKLNYTTIKRDTTIGIISITKSPTGDTITTIYGPIVKETETTGINTKHYYLHLFDLPVSIGIEQKLGRLKLCAEIGAAFNVGLSTTGNILTTDDNYEDVKQGGKFRSSIGVNYFGGVGVEMPITEKISLYGNLRGRYLPTDFTRADGSISQRYNTIGVNLGVVYSIK